MMMKNMMQSMIKDGKMMGSMMKSDARKKALMSERLYGVVQGR